MNDSSSRHLFILVCSAFAMLMLASVIPWSDLTGNIIKDFNIFEDLLAEDDTHIVYSEAPIPFEPADTPEGNDAGAETNSGGPDGSVAPADTIRTDTIPAEPCSDAPIVDGIVAIENYSGGTPLPRLQAAMAKADQRRVRIAVVGDSYIEGDIVCENLRSNLQERFGGHGVGYVPAHSDIPGFRTSVRQSDNGWTTRDHHNMGARDSLYTLAAEYFIGAPGSRSTYKGTSGHVASWQRSGIACVAPQGGTITIATDAGENTYTLNASPRAQFVAMDGTTSKATYRIGSGDVRVLGAYLDGATGVQVDCMAIRGYSGLPHTRVNADLARALAPDVDYDLVILEFGTNAVSAEQKVYTPYAAGMTRTIKHIQRCYPNADILLLGIGDRGIKDGTGVRSLPTCSAMVKAQRKAAADAGIHFWDTRAAMGGPGAIVDWRTRKLCNADYIHLNHDGGRVLASLLNESILQAINE